jgi:hypothetical protein
MSRFALAVVITLSLASPSVTSQTTTRSSQPVVSTNYSRAVEAANARNWSTAYRFLEDEFSHSNPERKALALDLLKKHPQILQSAVSTFSREEILDSIQRHGEEAAIRLEQRRIQMFATVADQAEVAKVNALLAASTKEVEENRKVREERENIERRKREADERQRTQTRLDSERAFAALMSKKSDPQMLYLRAGKFERDGDTSKARQLYEYLVETFSSTSWAVKANDRLLSLRTDTKPQSVGTMTASTDTCAKYYTGYSGSIDYVIRGGRRNIWGERLDVFKWGKFLVVGSGNGSVTIKGINDGSFLGLNEHQQFQCARLTELENTREINN